MVVKCLPVLHYSVEYIFSSCGTLKLLNCETIGLIMYLMNNWLWIGEMQSITYMFVCFVDLNWPKLVT